MSDWPTAASGRPGDVFRAIVRLVEDERDELLALVRGSSDKEEYRDQYLLALSSVQRLLFRIRKEIEDVASLIDENVQGRKRP